MIVHLPNLPPLSELGKRPKPLVMLVGQGDWQNSAAAEISRSAGCVIVTDQGDRSFVSGGWMEQVRELADDADVIGIWIGMGGLLLDEWTYAGYLVSRMPGEVIVGCAEDVEHPMAPGLVLLAQMVGVDVFGDYGQFLATVRNKARGSRQ